MDWKHLAGERMPSKSVLGDRPGGLSDAEIERATIRQDIRLGKIQEGCELAQDAARQRAVDFK